MSVSRLTRIAACCIPYAYLCLWGDVTHGTMLLYLPCIAACLLLMRGCRRISPALLSGHALSFLSSCLCLHLFHTERWRWYFKPFSAFQTLAALSLAAFFIHLFLCRKGKN